MLKDLFGIAAKGLIHRKLRSWLTMLGIFIGIAAIVSLIALGNGLRTSILNQFSFAGSDLIIISPGGIAGPPGTESGSSKLFEKDLRVVEREARVGLVAGFLTRTLRVGLDREEDSLLVFGFPTDDSAQIFDELSIFDVEEGRKLRAGDKNKAVLGWGIANQNVFEEQILLGKKILIEGEEYEVVGIRKRGGNPIIDNQVFVTLDTLRDVTGIEEEISGIRAKPKSGESVAATTEAIKRSLRRSRGVDAGEEDFSIQTSEQLLDSLGTILLVVQAVVLAIAAISLLVGGIGIMNTMYTSVLERTKEIGIMKALGARNGDVLAMFLIESGLLGLVGGGVGLAIGVGFGKLVEIGGAAAFGNDLIKAEISLALILGALLFSFIVGTVSGTLPAIQASRANPVEALRYE